MAPWVYASDQHHLIDLPLSKALLRRQHMRGSCSKKLLCFERCERCPPSRLSTKLAVPGQPSPSAWQGLSKLSGNEPLLQL
jgi:hypothetical protein